MAHALPPNNKMLLKHFHPNQIKNQQITNSELNEKGNRKASSLDLPYGAKTEDPAATPERSWMALLTWHRRTSRAPPKRTSDGGSITRLLPNTKAG